MSDWSPEAENEIEPIEHGRLFPLGGVVLFPNALLPLHIFEPRYRQMTEDALEDDRRITMVLPLNVASSEPVPIHPIGCVGAIQEEHRLPDGRFTLLLHGLARVEIEEISSDRLYRQARLRSIADVASPSLQTLRQLQRSRILACLRPLMEGSDNELAQQFFEFLSSRCSSGTFADLVSYWAPIKPEVKQELLAAASVDRRLEMLAETIPSISDASGWSDWPSFSGN